MFNLALLSNHELIVLQNEIEEELDEREEWDYWDLGEDYWNDEDYYEDYYP